MIIIRIHRPLFITDRAISMYVRPCHSILFAQYIKSNVYFATDLLQVITSSYFHQIIVFVSVLEYLLAGVTFQRQILLFHEHGLRIVFSSRQSLALNFNVNLM